MTARHLWLAAAWLLACLLGPPAGYAQTPAAPTTGPTETPAAAPTDAPTETPVAAPTNAPTETPPAAPAGEPTDTPVATTPVATATATQAAADTPTAMPPTATAVPSSGGGGGAAPFAATASGPASPAAPVSAALSGAGGTVSAALPGGQTIEVNVGAAVMSALQAALPNVAIVSVAYDPAPSTPNPAAAGSLGGGDAIPVAPPVDIKIVARDAGGNGIPNGSSSAPGVTIDLGMPVLPAPPGQPGGVFAWLEAVYSDGAFLGYIRPPADFDPASGRVTLHVAVSSLAGTLFLPAVIVPSWVQNFDAGVHMWSGPDATAVDFGVAGPQFTTFTVVAPQVGSRLYVYNPVSHNYGWIDVGGVGPAAPPEA